jgi:hypothetical protein
MLGYFGSSCVVLVTLLLFSVKVTALATTDGCCKECDRHALAEAKHIMVDPVRKIMLSFTPKAGCTEIVESFLMSVNIYRGRDYPVFPRTAPHDFRISNYSGMVPNPGENPCMLTSPEWYRFKMVRNPYSRAVSSYLHIMATLLNKRVFGDNYMKVSFKQHLERMLRGIKAGKPVNTGGHAGSQSLPFELQFPLFHRVIRLEDVAIELPIVNRESGSNFSLHPFLDHTFFNNSVVVEAESAFKKSSCDAHFVGTLTYEEYTRVAKDVGGKLDYSCFYDFAILRLVQQVYEDDIVLYGYEFPYILPDMRFAPRVTQPESKRKKKLRI